MSIQPCSRNPSFVAFVPFRSMHHPITVYRSLSKKRKRREIGGVYKTRRHSQQLETPPIPKSALLRPSSLYNDDGKDVLLPGFIKAAIVSYPSYSVKFIVVWVPRPAPPKQQTPHLPSRSFIKVVNVVHCMSVYINREKNPRCVRAIPSLPPPKKQQKDEF